MKPGAGGGWLKLRLIIKELNQVMREQRDWLGYARRGNLNLRLDAASSR